MAPSTSAAYGVTQKQPLAHVMCPLSDSMFTCALYYIVSSYVLLHI